MKRSWKLVGIALAVVILGVAAAGAMAYAQEGDDGYPFDFPGRFKQAIADVLGITVEEYEGAVEEAQNQVVDDAVTQGWLTEEQAELLQWRMDQAPDAGMWGMGRGHRPWGPGMIGGVDNLTSIAADQLGMSLTELLTALQDGKSIADVAAEKGVATESIVSAFLAGIKEDLDESVAEGRITQKQADYHLQQVEERVTGQLDNTWEGDFRGHGGPRGGMRGFPELGGF